MAVPLLSAVTLPTTTTFPLELLVACTLHLYPANVLQVDCSAGVPLAETVCWLSKVPVGAGGGDATAVGVGVELLLPEVPVPLELGDGLADASPPEFPVPRLVGDGELDGFTVPFESTFANWCAKSSATTITNTTPAPINRAVRRLTRRNAARLTLAITYYSNTCTSSVRRRIANY